jgi:hypothetical protein
MVLVSTITIKGMPGSTISVTEVRDDGGRITLVVRGAHVALEDIVVEHGEEREQADKAVGIQNCGIQDAGAGDNQAAETQQEEKKEDEEEGGEVNEVANASSPPSSSSSSTFVSVSLCAMFSSATAFSPDQVYNEPFYRILALMLDDTYKSGTFGIEWTRENGREIKGRQLNRN